MRWMIWPRQYGKTHQILKWWAEDPENRVVLCQNEEIARHHRRTALETIVGTFPNRWVPDNPLHVSSAFIQFTRANIMSYRSWRNASRGRTSQQIALDGDTLVIRALEDTFCHGTHELAIIAEAGRNEEPDPCIENQASIRHEEIRQQYGHIHPGGWDPGVC
jgi:hypothetical protein